MARFKTQTWSLVFSVTGFHVRLLFDIGFILRTVLFWMKKVVSGTRQPHGLALGLEEESLMEHFWLTLLVVTCPLLTLCWGGDGEEGSEQSSLAHLRGQREDRTLWLIVPLRPCGVAESCSPSEGMVLERQNNIHYESVTTSAKVPEFCLLFWFLSRWMGGFLTGRILAIFPLESNF